MSRDREKTCIVLGNGPSLKNVPNELLDKVPTFGSNGILLKYEPSYYVAVNPLAIARFHDHIEACESAKFLRADTETSREYHPLHSMQTPLFSYDPLHWIYEGHNVTFVCLQLAFYFGFTQVVLLGVDHRYVVDGQPNATQMLTGDDPNHFDPTYFKDSLWHLPDLKRSEEAYLLADKAFFDDDRKITNCTPDSALDVFAKGEIPWFLQ